MSQITTLTLLSNGTAIPTAYADIIDVEITNKVNKVPFAQIVLRDGSQEAQTFAVSSSQYYALGTTLEVQARYEGEGSNQTLFKGIVIAQNIRTTLNSGTLLVVELCDKSNALVSERKNSVYTNQSDSEVIKTILSTNGVGIGEISTTQGTHPQLIQYECSDWDFLMMRADVNGLIVCIHEGKLSAIQPSLKGESVFTFNYGITPCMHFNMSADVRHQFDAVQATSWDIQTQQCPTPSQANETAYSLGQGDLNLSKITATLEKKTQTLITGINATPDEMKSWATARLIKSRLSLFQGTITLEGNASLVLGGVITLEGLGDLFNGKALITGVMHHIHENSWQTTVQIGMPNQWYERQYPDINTAPASGLLAGIKGLQVGIIQAFEEDPEKEYRLQVKIPTMLSSNNENTLLARLAAPYLGLNKGLFFIPDVGDEVIVGFINDDPRDAIILGSVYSQKNTPPKNYPFDAQNNLQGIITKGGLEVQFNDDENAKAMSLQTPEGNTVLLEDEKGITLKDKSGNQWVMSDKGVSVEDCNGNKMVLGSEGITLNSSGVFKLEASGDVELKTSGAMKLEASMIDLN